MASVPSSTTGSRATVFQNLGPILMLLLAAFFWGSGNVANKTVLTDIDPWTAVVFRCLVAALVLAPFCVGELRLPRADQWLRSSLFPSVLFAGALALQQWGYETATVTNASFLVNAACVLTPLIAFAMFREAAGRPTILAAFLMFSGAFIMSGAGASLSRVNPGDMLCLMSALIYAAWAVALGRHAMRHGRPVATTLVHCLFALGVTLPVASVGWPLEMPSVWNALPEVLYLGVFSTALAFLLMVAAQAQVSASIASVLVAAESLFGAAGGIIMLGERPTMAVFMGAGLISAAIVVIGRSPRHAQAEPAVGLT